MTSPFISLADLSDLLGSDVSTEDLAVIAIDSACESVRTYLDNPVNLVEDEIIRLDGSGTYRLVLPRPPVREVTAVTELATTTTDEVILDAEVDFVLERGGILRRIDYVWLRGSGNIEVTYSHGWDISEAPVWERVPSDIRRVALELAKRLYQAGQVAAGGITSETVGSYSYTVDPAAGGALELTPHEMARLDPYRTPHTGAVYVSTPGGTS